MFPSLSANAFCEGDEPHRRRGTKLQRDDGGGIASEAEIHTHYTGIICPEGAAAFVAGRGIVHPKTAAPGEIRGESTQRGVAQRPERTASSWCRPARRIGLKWAFRHLLDVAV